MELREERLAEVVVGYRCDICNQPCFKVDDPDRADSSEYALLRGEWGYWSNKDCQVHECHMCEACYDKVREFIEQQLKGKVRVRECLSVSAVESR